MKQFAKTNEEHLTMAKVLFFSHFTPKEAVMYMRERDIEVSSGYITTMFHHFRSAGLAQFPKERMIEQYALYMQADIEPTKAPAATTTAIQPALA